MVDSILSGVVVPGTGAVYVFDQNGALKATLDARTLSSNPIAVAFDSLERLYVSRDAVSTFQTDIFSSDIRRDATLPFGGNSFAFDASSHGFVATDAGDVTEFTSSGVIGSFSLPHVRVTSIDLAADRCTLFYIYALPDETARIGRYDLCAHAVLSDVPGILPVFPSASGQRRVIRILPGGSLLITAATSAQEVTTDGVLVRTYTIPALAAPQWLGLALNPTGTQFWVAVDRNIGGFPYALYRIDLDSGAVVQGPLTVVTVGGLRSMAVAGEWRAAANVEPIPVAPTEVLLLLAVALVSVAVTRIGGHTRL